MQPNKHPAKPSSGNADNSFSLLEYEINRTKHHIHAHGATPHLQERLNRLEALLDICLAGTAGDRAM